MILRESLLPRKIIPPRESIPSREIFFAKEILLEDDLPKLRDTFNWFTDDGEEKTKNKCRHDQQAHSLVILRPYPAC